MVIKYQSFYFYPYKYMHTYLNRDNLTFFFVFFRLHWMWVVVRLLVGRFGTCEYDAQLCGLLSIRNVVITDRWRAIECVSWLPIDCRTICLPLWFYSNLNGFSSKNSWLALFFWISTFKYWWTWFFCVCWLYLRAEIKYAWLFYVHQSEVLHKIGNATLFD